MSDALTVVRRLIEEECANIWDFICGRDLKEPTAEEQEFNQETNTDEE